MFSVLISEKGGAERRESFERMEINVGRVQGNDLMLPKGNVSKRHARLLYRDGRFIVTDLKSTNGTYVNGRKIAQATIVREGDKIYIGDFVLRVEMGGGSSSARKDGSDTPPLPLASDTDNARATQAPPERAIGQRPPTGREQRAAEPSRNSQDVVSHFPLEHDPDDDSLAMSQPPMARAAITRMSGVPSVASSSPRSPPGTAGTAVSTQPTAASAVITGPPTQVPGRKPPSTSEPNERDRASITSQPSAPMTALTTLIERVNAGLDLSILDKGEPVSDALEARIEQALSDKIAAMKIASELSNVPPETLLEHARRELFELGPIGPLMDNEDVSELQVIRHDYVVALHTRKLLPLDMSFTSEQALARAIRRLCVMAGRPLGEGELYVDRRLPRGARLSAVLPPASDQGHVVVIRKPQRADLSLDDLVRSGTISRTMAGLFSNCVAARANILIVGALGSGTTSLLGALAATGSMDDRVVVLQEEDELVLNQPHTVSIALPDTGPEGARAVQTAARMRPDRLVVGSFAGEVAAELIEAIGEGTDGVLAATRAPTLRHALARLAAGFSAARPGCGQEAAREWLASSFDLVLEVAKQRDGRHRVQRVAELRIEGNAIVAHDIWAFVIERTAAGGALEGTFHATGVVPTVAEALIARGIPIDPAIFRRHQTR